VVFVGTTIFEESLDPVKGGMSYGYPFTNCALLRVNKDSKYEGDMATDWTTSSDALVYTFHLRQGVKFSNGSDFNADDVVFTYNTVRNNQADNQNVDLTKLASAKKIDDNTVAFTLSQPYSPFLDTVATLGIVPSDGYDSKAFDQKPIGTGPWKVVQYDANQQIIVEPNESYYQGAPSIKKVTLVHMDADKALSAAQSGQLDIVMVGANYASEKVAGMHIQPFETMDIRMISLPVLPEQTMKGKDGNDIAVGNNVTSDINVRKALAIGLDRKTVIRNAFNGIGKPAYGFTGNLIWANAEAYADNRKEEAKKLLEDAGWKDADGDGIREKNGVKCQFPVLTASTDKERYLLASAVAEDAARLGIKIDVKTATWDEIRPLQNSNSNVWGWGQYNPTVLYTLFDSANFISGNNYNAADYSNSKVDALIKKAMDANSQESATAAWKQAQAVANADYPYLYLVNIEHCYFVSDALDVSLDTQIAHPHGHGSPIICNMKDWKLK
jgi:peptide/nickel transport system substrate-binding protein